MFKRGEHICKKGMYKGKFRFEARMIRNYHGLGRYEYLTHLTWSGDQSLFLCYLMEVTSRKRGEGSVLYLSKSKSCHRY